MAARELSQPFPENAIAALETWATSVYRWFTPHVPATSVFYEGKMGIIDKRAASQLSVYSIIMATIPPTDSITTGEQAVMSKSGVICSFHGKQYNETKTHSDLFRRSTVKHMR